MADQSNHLLLIALHHPLLQLHMTKQSSVFCINNAKPRNSVSAFADQLITITSQPQYSGHSLEELRVAFLQAGRELTSAEITARSPAPPQRAFGTSSYPFTPSTASRRF
ncbi:hypothetical protein E4T56_gene16446 [Termitomyces sp. T112]|nr:hypothetical protein E4T56_gene16446 [Termitomyces sp. T112]